MTARYETIKPDPEILRIVEKCIDVMLTEHMENHETAREIARMLAYPLHVVKDPG